MPCGCNLCEHFIEVFHSLGFSKRFDCKCSKEYSRQDMVKLGILFLTINDIKNENHIISYFNSRLNNNCCVGNESIKENDVKIIKNVKCLDYKVLNVNEEILNKFLSKLNHKICGKCQQIDLSNGFFCSICEINHYISN